MKKLSIVIPVYNEENTIGDVLSKVESADTPGYKKEIIVINDGSTDGTKKVLEKWVKKIVFIDKSNGGKGSALQKGFEKATGEIVLIQDADLEYSPDDYPNLLKPFEHAQVDVVYGSRFLGAHLSTVFVYTFGNKLVTLLTNLLYNTNLTDMETGYKVFRKKVLDGIRIQSKSFDFEPEITAKILRRGYQIYEIPITYFGRKFSEGKKLTWKDGISAIIALIKFRLLE